MDLFCCTQDKSRKVATMRHVRASIRYRIKECLKDATYAVQARAVKDYTPSMQENNHLAFRQGDLIRVLEQHGSGMWKGYILGEDGPRTKPGYFPASHVVLVDNTALSRNGSNGSNYGSSSTLSRQHGANTPVAELISRQHQCHGNGSVVGGETGYHGNGDCHHHHSYATVGVDESFPPPPSPLVGHKAAAPYREPDRDSGISPQQHYPPQHFPSPQGYPPGRQPSPNSPAERTAEWIGRYVDPNNSPRESPSNSNRNSIASNSSGGGSAHFQGSGHHYVSPGSATREQHRLSGTGSYESGVSSQRHSFHSNSSAGSAAAAGGPASSSATASIGGSLERLEESGYGASTSNVSDLFHAGYTDEEVLRTWLCELQFDDYVGLFVAAGYDMPTISRMTPEDLTAIGIQKPAHRKRLKAEISKLHIADGIPDFKPNDVSQWLGLLGLGQYYSVLLEQGYTTMDSVTDITWEDLEEIGIKMLGHQKKLMLALDRLRRIQQNSRRLSAMTPGGQRRGSTEALLEPPSAYPGPGTPGGATPAWMERERDKDVPPPAPGPPPYHSRSYSSGGSSSGSSTCSSSSTADVHRGADRGDDPPGHHGGSSEILALRKMVSQHNARHHTVAPPNVVAIKVNRAALPRGTSVTEGDSEPDSEPGNSLTYQSFREPAGRHGDGDATPTNDKGGLSADEQDSGSPGGSCYSTLKRPAAVVSPRVSPKPPKPVAKITPGFLLSQSEWSASGPHKTTDSIPDATGSKVTPSAAYSPYNSGTLPRRSKTKTPASAAEHIYDAPAVEVSAAYGATDGAGYLQTPLRAMSSAPGSPARKAAGGGKKPPPPPPPKRTNSIKDGLAGGWGPPNTPPAVSPKPAAPYSPSTTTAFSYSPATAAPPALGDKFRGTTSAQTTPRGHPTPPPVAPKSPGRIAAAAAAAAQQQKAPPMSPKTPVAVTTTPSPLTTPLPSPPSNAHDSAVSTATEDFPPPPPPITHQPTKVAPPTPAKPSTTPKPAAGGTSPQPPSSSLASAINPLNDVIHQLELQASSLATFTTTTVTTTTTATAAVHMPQQKNLSRVKQQEEYQSNSSENSSSDNDSDSGHDSDKQGKLSLSASSSGSIDSNTLPFANENVGTIKQRSQPQAKPSIVPVDETDGCAPGGMFSVEDDVEDTGTIKRNRSLPNGDVKKVPPPTPKRRDSMGKADAPAAAAVAAPAANKESMDVLNDIDSMLQGLTDELDAMLEFELT